ncbi:MAG: circadian clock protein KaiB [candidate division Zixibacteria bacterium]|nr:circadian clock protein KaiB [candidate division Zixibacteria bacterium]
MGQKGQVKLTLYFSKSSTPSEKVVSNLIYALNLRVEGKLLFEVVDVETEPEKTEANKIVAVPSLVKEYPPPTRRIVGDLTSYDEIWRLFDFDGEHG